MSNIEGRIKLLAAAQNVAVSHHAAGQLRKRGISLADCSWPSFR